MTDITTVSLPERFLELAKDELLGLLTDETKAEFKELKKAFRKANKPARVAKSKTPEAIIAKLQAKIAAINETIAYVAENGVMPPKPEKVEGAKRGRKAKAVEAE